MAKQNQLKQNQINQMYGRQVRQCRQSILIAMLILIFIIIIPDVNAIPQIQLVSQINPLEYGSIQNIVLEITPNATNTTENETFSEHSQTNTTITQALIEFDGQNHTLQKQDTQYIYSWIPGQKGTNSYVVYSTNSLSQTNSYAGSFQVQDTIPPEIIELQPQGKIDYNLIELTAITNENSTCKYDTVDISYDSMTFGLTGTGATHSKLRSFSDGQQKFYVKCKDPENNIAESQIMSFSIDTTPPTITSITPTGTVNQEQVTLRIITNEQATCKWGMTNQAYVYLPNTFQIKTPTEHLQILTLNQGINTYYVSCRDTIGNILSPITINLELNLAPTASVNVNIENEYTALKQGIYTIALAASESLIQAPDLKLRYNNKQINIPLEGSASYWKGYLIIPGGAGQEIGEFKYTGTDLKGTVGTEITSGKLVLLDTAPPATPGTPRLINENNKIKASWNYEGEETNHFRIYRSTTGTTDKSDFYKTTKETFYLDSNVTNKIGYFYRISAVDKAGNEGLLSEEKFMMTEYQDVEGVIQQDPELLIIINNKISQLERLIQDLEVRKTELEETTDQLILQVINQQELVTKLKETEDKIKILIGELKTYKEILLTRGELDTRISILDTKLEEYKKEIVKEVKITNKVQTEQTYRENILRQAVDEYLKDKGLTEEQKIKYYDKTISLQDEIRIQQEIASYIIEYEYNINKEIIYLKENVFPTKNFSKIIIHEILPKDVVKISEITFSDPPDEINSQGVFWVLTNLDTAEISYSIEAEKDLNKLQSIQTILLYDVDDFLSMLAEEQIQIDNTNQITGDAANILGGKEPVSLTTILIAIGVVLILALLFYYVGFMKTEKNYEQELSQEFNNQEKKLISEISTIKQDKAQIRSQINPEDNIWDCIRQAHEALLQSNLEEASRMYSCALSLYSFADIGYKERFKVNLEMNLLREKIVLMLKSKHLYS